MINKVFFDITGTCNASCKYCFTNSSNIKIQEELNENQIIEAFRKIKKSGINKISVGGGEPFLKDIVKIINANKDIKISITTNGTILNKEILECLEENKNVSITISLDSLNNEISNKVRKGINTEKVISNILTLVKNKRILDRISIRTTISKHNINDIYEVIDFCKKNNIKKLKVNSTNEFGRAKRNKSIIMPFEQFMEMLDEILIYCEKEDMNNVVELPIEKYLTTNQECLCGTTSLYINWIGDIFPCAFTEKKLKQGNVKDKNFEEILNKLFNHNNEVCKQCAINRYKAYDKKTLKC